MTLSLHGVRVLTEDADAALAFYRDVLGLTVRDDVTMRGYRWVTLSDRGGARIVLTHPHADRSPEDGAALAALLAGGELHGPSFRTDDLDATFARIAAAPGVEVLQEPITRPDGVRDAALFDPARNLIRIVQRASRRHLPEPRR